MKTALKPLLLVVESHGGCVMDAAKAEPRPPELPSGRNPSPAHRASFRNPTPPPRPWANDQ
eukprot:3030449-Pyramimonas_sp.AAC.1